MTAIVVILAGTVGALLRYALTRAFANRPARLPWAVLVANVVGSFLGGVALGAAWSPELRIAVLTGLCGGLTTFSTLGVETIQLVLDRRLGAAVASVAANLVLGIGAAALGWWLASAFA